MRAKKARKLLFRKNMKDAVYITHQVTGEIFLDPLCGRALYKKAKKGDK